MKKVRLALALAGIIVSSHNLHAQYADAVMSYNSGAGFATGFTNASAALGAPALGASVTPFAPPFSKSQIVSVGAGGEITLQMSTPIVNNPDDPYGVNFILFANQFFVEGSGGKASGLFDHAASIEVQVSQDDSTWYTLNPALAPQPGTLYPTAGNGNPLLPVNPALTLSDFEGQNLAGIESLYDGSAGGTGYDLSWAETGGGASVDLSSADYVRIEVQSGVLDLDAASVVQAVPDRMMTAFALAGLGAGLFWLRPPRKYAMSRSAAVLLLAGVVCAAPARAATFTENFTTNPLQNGWQVFGDTNLFQWDATNQVMDVTWDSSQSNSYFYHPLGTILTINDSFSLAFDLNLSSQSAVGYFELAVGLFNVTEATNADFSRALVNSPNLFEFDYYPASGGEDASIDATLADMTVTETNDGDFYFAYDDVPLLNNVTYHVILTHEAGEGTIEGEVLTNGTVYTALPNMYPGPITDFRIGTVAIINYTSTDDPYGDAVNAQGAVGNVVVTMPPPPVQNLTLVTSNALCQAQFCSQTNWLYVLQRTCDFQSWTNVTPPISGNGTNLVLQDPAPPGRKAFYRVNATRP